MMKKSKHEIRHSVAVEDIINTPPKSAVRWGTTIVGLVILLLLILSWLIKYPYVIRAEAIVTTTNPPAAIVARVSGKIEKLFVKDGEEVSRGQILGIMETTTSHEKVMSLLKMIDSLNIPLQADRERGINRELPSSPGLGEIQDQYSAFRKSYYDYYNHVVIDPYGKKTEAVREEISSIDDYINKLKSKETITASRLELEKKKYLRDSLLNAREILPDAGLEVSKQKYYSLKIELVQVALEIASRRIELSSRKQLLHDLEASRMEEREKYLSILSDKLTRLRARIDWWIQTHVLTSPLLGKVTFTEFWSENQAVKEGETVMTVVPTGENEIIARLMVPMKGSGKVETGQRVNIQLEGYPYLEYGMVKGFIRSKSLVPKKNMYVMDVFLPRGLSTFYDKTLEFNQNMTGQAEIITEDIRLIDRIIYPFKFLFEKNRN